MITIGRLRSELKLPATRDADIALWRDGVIKLWETRTLRPWLAREDHVETIEQNTPTVDVLFLALRPVTAITQIRVRSLGLDGCLPDTNWTTLTDTKFFLYGLYKLRRIGRQFWEDLVEVTYDGGVTEADEDIQRALILQIQFQLTRNDNSKIAVRSQNFEGGAGVFEEAFLHPTFKGLAELKKRKA